MAASLTVTNVLGTLAAGNQNLSLIDADFTQLFSGINNLNNFGNYYTDSGSASAYAITVPTAQTYTFAAGLPLQFRAITANTGASTLQITSGATNITKNIINPDGTALVANQIQANAIVSVISDGTSCMFIGAIYPVGFGNQSANKVFAGPTSGTATSATFRSLVAADIATTATQASTFSFNNSGGTSASVNIVLQKEAGNFVRAYLPAVTATSGTASTAFQSNTALPAGFRPSTNTQSVSCNNILNNSGGTNDAGFIQITTGGILIIERNPTGTTAWANAVTCGTVQDMTFNYYVG